MLYVIYKKSMLYVIYMNSMLLFVLSIKLNQQVLYHWCLCFEDPKLVRMTYNLRNANSSIFERNYKGGGYYPFCQLDIDSV